MKRTVEIVLAIIGALLYAFFAFMGGLLIWVQNNKDVMRDIFEETQQEAGITMNEFNSMLESIGGEGWMLAIFSSVAVIVGIIAIVFLKGNKRPKPAGIMLIIVAVLSLILLGFGTWIIAIFYAICGIVALTRKPKGAMEQ
ncbi:DUF4064 domain-containing protein [Virgibacillus alimentarius]|uniref:DUF4064 domain-containing protein n=1 Tax=Virgibacillus alimentarius TaxID=698769 RepID=A0ABS4SBN9_9BACI|nr:DUF4064 domain-containing protein [Virgibacillus alimentarius]MBP2258911.1 hypothetical protein [Virgibacillus alimentarius]